MTERVYVFLDESGNLDFSRKGTRYFVLTSVSTRRPFRINGELDSYKYHCIEFGLEKERFHCVDDNRHVRRSLFEIIGNELNNMDIYSLIVEKRKTGPALTFDTRFYPEMLGYLLRWVLGSPSHRTADEVVIITDTIPLKRRRQSIEKAIKNTLGVMVPRSSSYRILHHDSRSHYGLQVADYCCWAIYRRWESSDEHYYSHIKSAVRSEFDIFQTGSTYFY